MKESNKDTEDKPKESKEKSKESKEKPKESREKSKERPKESKDKPKELKDVPKSPERSSVLRKRTASSVGVPQAEKAAVADDMPRSPTSPVTTDPNALVLKPGQSILEQIGTPDHEGWLRKKGEKYNSWKVRYFVLKGPHLYWLRNKSKAVRGSVNVL